MPIRHYLPILALFTLIGCFEEPEYANEPAIEFVSIRARTINSVEDSIAITISFQDGDGDLGLNKGDGEEDANDPKFAEFELDDSGMPVLDSEGDSILNKFRFNYFLKAFIEVDGVYQEAIFLDNQTLDGTFPRLSDSEKEKALEGEITFYNLYLYDFAGSPFNRGDLVKFEVQIADRNLNLSNTIETTPIIIGEN